ncbi:MAG: DUF2721 domain-containing protein [Hyphomicrobiales bacterium]
MTASASSLIQVALAPIFLLTAISGTLAVIDTRLNRIVDRTRQLEARILDRPALALELEEEIRYFERRARGIAVAVALCTLAGLCIAAVVVLIFIDLQIPEDLTMVEELVFTVAVIFYVSSLVMYLRDVLRVADGIEFASKRLDRAVAAGRNGDSA